MCPKCRIRFNEETGNLETAIDTKQIDDGGDLIPEVDNGKEETKKNLNDSLEEIEVSPVKLHSIPSHSRMSYGKRKIKQVFSKLEEKETKIQHQVAEVMNISAEDLSIKVDAP